MSGELMSHECDCPHCPGNREDFGREVLAALLREQRNRGGTLPIRPDRRDDAA